ncbi:MAG: type II toxin-antitoxin system HicB family antitoxin [Chloroflexi bacterium]|nr:type II toxin-antitoxin system HicB family antitoxin [Chloroflexota bacterium]
MKMKTIEYYLGLPYQLIVTPDEEGYGVAVAELPGCFTHAEKWEEIPEMVREAIELWIQVMMHEGRIIPEPTPDSVQHNI